MKRFALLTLAVSMMALGGGQVAHAGVVAGCTAFVPGQPAPLGVWRGDAYCSERFYVPADGRYTISLNASGHYPYLPGTGEFFASVSGGTHAIRARFVAGVLVDGVASSTADLAAGWHWLSVQYMDPPVIDRCVGLLYGYCLYIRYHPGFGGADGSVTST